MNEGRRKKEEGRRKKEEGRRKKEEGRRKKEEGIRRFIYVDSGKGALRSNLKSAKSAG
ncbi:MAG: hypothetical protein KME60_31775 [Cyanomargarita calcarea GSE-NOS-MK-12-04C]|uniref:Uncharacterized protein n=1 Tax=Cyanomargarita calcarea GSE-NOS-MK-12-04C TaxID=2839659 RepID=A0A951QTL7_9CYAN|nr:hypothetical protein [Cyanomargarita calcarea GSE-NOS-MK-12-04C]